MSLALTLEGVQLSLLGTSLLGFGFATEAHAAPRQPVVTIEECRNIDDKDVRAKLAELTSKALTEQLQSLNYEALVESHWNRTHVTDKIDREIDDAVAASRADTSWLERAHSTISRESAEKFATAIADRAYNSEGFRNALAELAGSIGKEVGEKIEKAADQVASPVIACVQSALQTRYGSAVAQVFSQETQDNFRVKSETAGAKITTGDMMINTAPTVAGVALVVTRRIVGEMIASIGKRVAGMVASRIASSITGVIGFALIAVDVYQAGDGVFPTIADRMKATETKDLIKQEVAKSIESDVKVQTTTIGQETATRLYAFWLDFKQKYDALLVLSDKNPRFADFLKDRRVDQLAKLSQIASVVINVEGEEGVFRRAADGSLSKALTDLDMNGIQILDDKKSIDLALRWTELAGPSLDKVVAFGLHKSIPPSEITSEQLRKILQIDDRLALSSLMKLDRPTRDAILSLPIEQLRDLLRTLQPKEIDAFASYQKSLKGDAAARVLHAVAHDTRVMRNLAGPGVREAILSSKEQTAAVDMLVRDEFPSVFRLNSDFELVTRGDVDFRVFFYAYWVALSFAAFVALVLLMLLRRLLFGPPTRIVVHTSRDK
jgi:DNA-binding HxlR family transcriptional regulator